MQKILFLTTGHRFDDDRIFHHQAKELVNNGFDVKICSLSSEFEGIIDEIEIESYSVLGETSSQKIDTFQKVCNFYKPDCIICSEPLAVIASKKYKRNNNVSIIYDVTEWYPSMRMVNEYTFLLKIIHAFKFFLIQLYAGLISTHFIFGERTKMFPLAYVFPFKNKIILPYFPDDKYIYKSVNKLYPHKIKLCYTGIFSKEKGIENFFMAVNCFQKKCPNIELSILLIGGTRKISDQKYFEDLLCKYNWENIEIRKTLSFEDFTKAFSEADICFDLRDLNFENNHCLPIKIFYYAATGKPVIYTNLKATRKHVDVSKFGYLVNPEDYEGIADLIANYIYNPETYNTHAVNARREFELKYNWNVIRDNFSNFIKESI